MPEPRWITYAPALAISRDELVEDFSRASGPGGQHVNTTASAVELRFDAAQSPNLPPAIKARLKALAGRRLTRDGVLVIRAEGFRSQQRNREDALQRLLELLAAAAIPPKPRRATRPTLGSKTRRLAGKAVRSAVKNNRRKDLGPSES